MASQHFENLGYEALYEVARSLKKASRNNSSFMVGDYYNYALENVQVANKFFRKAGVNIETEFIIYENFNTAYSWYIKGNLSIKVLKNLRFISLNFK